MKTGKPFRGQLQNLKKKRLYFFESVVAMKVVRSGHFKPIGFIDILDVVRYVREARILGTFSQF